MRKLASVFVFFALVSCGGNEAGTWVVTMQGHSFEPDSMTVGAGELVTWTNDTDEAHTVTAVQDSLPQGADYFSSGGAPSEEDANDDITAELIEPGETFEWTSGEPGTYSYYCIPHRGDGMEGTIVVEP